ncbi:Preprotein translocase subunit SecG [Lacicoccus alkaliphilus]|uniref:Uncharacterized protein n=1 Tax=Lacicoccus alkaliphilus DSM 16010 TaxID=1123231 RepID=A0A1M7B0Y7_9BACL|nr:hypothetical protein SAMN02745189_00310 [Salinicoccus alkaliphilus DSM 16010]
MGLIILVFIIAVSVFVVFKNAKEMESDADVPKDKYGLSKRFMFTVIGSFVFLLVAFVIAFIYL